MRLRLCNSIASIPRLLSITIIHFGPPLARLHVLAAGWPPTLFLQRVLSVLSSMGSLVSLDLFYINEFILCLIYNRI